MNFIFLTEAITDSVKMLPFLFGAYLLIEFLEHRSSEKMERALQKSGKWGVLAGSLLSCVPQCGFSVFAANLYAGRVITVGTLMAVFIATSDEAIPILLVNPGSFGTIMLLLGIKLLVALAAGWGLDLGLRSQNTASDRQEQMEHLCKDCGCHHGIVRSALRHTIRIFLFILLISIFLGAFIQWVGEDRLSQVLMSGSFLQPLVTALVGFVPNCVASVVITQFYITGGVSFGATVAGLITSAGVGMLVLFRVNRNWKQNITLCLLLYLIGALTGMIVQLF